MRIIFGSHDVEELRKEGMVVDMHFHSRYSHDSSTSVKSIIERAEQLGVYVVLTDHNEIKGVLEAHRIAPGRIKPGIEVTTKEGKDILLYFYTVRELKEFFENIIHPHIRNKSSLRGGRTGLRLQDLITAASNARCVIAIAHPFAVGPRRSYLYFKRHRDLLKHFHAIEVANQALPHKGNLLAIGWAAENGKTVIGGSDGHVVKMLGTAFTISPAQTWRGFLDNVKNGETTVVGEERKLRHHIINMTRILREKGKVIQNRRIRNGTA